MQAGASADAEADAAARYPRPMPALIRFLQLIPTAHGRLKPGRLHLAVAGYLPGGSLTQPGVAVIPPDLDLS